MTRTQRELLSILAELEDGREYTWNIARARDPEGWDALASRGLFHETGAKQRKARAVRQVLARLEGLVTLDGYAVISRVQPSRAMTPRARRRQRIAYNRIRRALPKQQRKVSRWPGNGARGWASARGPRAMRWAHVAASYGVAGRSIEDDHDLRWGPARAYGVLRWAVRRGLINQ